MQQCNHKEIPEVTTTIIHDTIPGDPYPVISYLDKPVPFRVEVPGDTFWKYHKVDTAAILKDYFSRKIYGDTLKDDTSAFIALIDTVYMNQLHKRTLIFQNRRATEINTTINNFGEVPRNKFFFGVSIGRSLNNFAAGPSLLWVTKKSFAYGLMYDVVNKDFYGTFYYKIGFKRKK
jgi:hypothetical protein